MTAPERWSAARRSIVDAFELRSKQVLLLAAVVGVLTGLGVALFETVVVEVILDPLLELPVWALALMPTVGLAIAAIALHTLGSPDSGTTDAYLQAFHDSSRALTPRTVPARMLAAIATLGFGGAMGLEGPSLYLGASIGAAVQARFHRFFRTIDYRVLIVAGAAAGVAAIFKAPATGVVSPSRSRTRTTSPARCSSRRSSPRRPAISGSWRCTGRRR